MKKPIIYAEIPVFDQLTQYVIQKAPVDMGDYIFIGVEVLTMDNQAAALMATEDWAGEGE